MLNTLRSSSLLPVLPLILVSCGAGSNSAHERGSAPPDVLVLLVDTLRADRLGCYGNERDTTPTLDTLAKRGVLCSRASAQAPWTIPSVSSLITGYYLTSHQERPRPDATTMAEAFQAAGYRTLASVANLVILPEVGFERGFDVFKTRHFVDERGRPRRLAEDTFDDTVSWVRDEFVALTEGKAPGERQPMFLFLHVTEPHEPYLEHTKLSELLPIDSAPPIEPEGWLESTLSQIGPPAPDDDPGWETALGLIVQERNNYDREVRDVDNRLGKLLGEFGGLGLLDNLLIAVVSDHGEELWEHLAPIPPELQVSTPPGRLFFQSHGYLLTEQALRTPFLLSGPGVPANVVLDAPVENVDLLPTLLELCDIGVGFEPHGRSLVPLFRSEGASDELRDETFAYVKHGMMMREEATGLKLVLPTEEGRRLRFQPKLFDLHADPLERINLFDHRPEDVARLTNRLMSHLEQYPSTEQTVQGKEAARLLEMLEEFGYSGDMVRGGEQDPQSE